MTLFSVIIPVYNTKKYIKKCINSVLNQKTIDKIEIILINDSSNDGSEKIIQSYKNNNIIKIINNKKNLGVGISRNYGIAAATGEYILFLDSDDCLYKNSLKKIEKLIEKKPLIDVIIGKFQSEQYPYSNDYLFKKKSANTNKFIEHINAINYQANVCWHYIINRKFIINNKLNFIDVKINEDQEFVARLLCLMKSFAFYDKKFYWHRERKGSLNRSIDLKTTESFPKILFKFNEFINEKKLSKERKKYINLKIETALGEFAARLIHHNKMEIIKISKIFDNYRKNKKNIKNIKINNKLYSFCKNKKNYNNILLYKEKIINKILNKLRNNKYKNKYIYCASVFGFATLKILKKNNHNVLCFFDENKVLQKQKFNNISIKDPLILLKKTKKNLSNVSIIICNQTLDVYKKIFQKLLKYSLNKNQIFHIKY